MLKRTIGLIRQRGAQKALKKLKSENFLKLKEDDEKDRED